VTTLRSSRADVSSAASATPQPEQNLAPGWLECPHEGQSFTREA
jgi:hypothetical protein